MKHLIDWKFWTPEEVQEVLALAHKVKHSRWQYQGYMQGNALAMIFQKTSTRTRVSFEAGMNEMGGHAINLDWINTNFTLSKPEYESRYLSRNVAFIMARLKHHRDLLSIMGGATVPVINGCCNLYHPCQTLADMLTILEDRGSLEGAKLTYVGMYNNVVNSLVSICAALGVELTLVCPNTDDERRDQESLEKLAGLGLLHEVADPKEGVEGADYVYTDTWVDMEHFNDAAKAEEHGAFLQKMRAYQLNEELLEGVEAKVMHDMPIHPGYEISESLIDDPRAIIYDQAENRLDAQKAILIFLKEQRRKL